MKLPKVYEASDYESDIYALWEKSGVFTADANSSKEHFSISMPPPNETGTLHIGHALFITLQDIMARHARQQGKDVLWLPGTVAVSRVALPRRVGPLLAAVNSLSGVCVNATVVCAASPLPARSLAPVLATI